MSCLQYDMYIEIIIKHHHIVSTLIVIHRWVSHQINNIGLFILISTL